jgi:AraC-like DNA-binding protein
MNIRERLVPNERFMLHGMGYHQTRHGREKINPAVGASQPFYSLIFTHVPVMAFVNSESPQQLAAHTLVIWDRTCRVDYGAPASEWSISWLQPWGTCVDDALRKLRLPQNRPVVFPDARAVERCLVAIRDEMDEHAFPDLDLLENHVNGLLLEVRRCAALDRSRMTRVPESVQSAKRYIDSHPDRALSLEEIAHRAHLAPTYLCRRFSEFYGVSPIRYATEHRLDTVKSHLCNRDLTIQQAAARAGYDDVFSFSKLFKRHTGLSPKTYRERAFRL